MPTTETPFRLDGPLRRVPAIGPLALDLAERALAFERLANIYRQLSREHTTAAGFAARALETLQVHFEIDPAQRALLPVSGPAVVVANHPYGGIEGLFLISLLAGMRSDTLIVANRLLHRIPEIRDCILRVDAFGGTGAARYNTSGLRRALRHVRDGGLLVLFPSGTVSHLHLSAGRVCDPPWSPSAARLLRMCDCPVTPVHFGGGNGAVFQTLGLLHPRMRTALLSRELLGHRHRNIPVTIGRAIPAERIRDQPDDAILASSLRLATYALEARQVRPRRLEREMAPVDAAVPTALLEAEIGCLDASQSLATLAQLARPRRPFRRTHSLAALGGDLARLSSVEELSRLVEEMEPDGKGVPVLLRQYLKLGARMVGFNVDRSFGDVVDAMIVVDLLRTEPRTLQKYMGKAQAEKFLARERSAA